MAQGVCCSAPAAARSHWQAWISRKGRRSIVEMADMQRVLTCSTCLLAFQHVPAFSTRLHSLAGRRSARAVRTSGRNARPPLAAMLAGSCRRCSRLPEGEEMVEQTPRAVLRVTASDSLRVSRAVIPVQTRACTRLSSLDMTRINCSVRPAAVARPVRTKYRRIVAGPA
jgi:hypothetical protein